LIGFKGFRDRWVDFCIQINREGLSKGERGKGIGAEFEKYFFENVLSSFKTKDQKIVSQKKISGINYKWDFLLVKQNVSDIFDIDPSKVVAAFEVKAHGSQNYYMLSDSGDGVQLPPKAYFPNEWDRLIKDLAELE
jgi:hypothetical protein